MSTYIEETLEHLRRPFVIKEDGTSQTHLTNRGRVGFYVERLFDILPNNDREPDFGRWELKTVRRGRKITIGTMPDAEVRQICQQSEHDFSKSDPYKKMKNTVFVIYDKVSDFPEPTYVMHGWGTCQLNAMNRWVKDELQNDYSYICRIIKAKSHCQDTLTEFLIKHGSMSGTFLTLGYKGQGYSGYNYPAWSFTSKFVNQLNHA